MTVNAAASMLQCIAAKASHADARSAGSAGCPATDVTQNPQSSIETRLDVSACGSAEMLLLSQACLLSLCLEQSMMPKVSCL
jgi:hypothetical protein